MRSVTLAGIAAVLVIWLAVPAVGAESEAPPTHGWSFDGPIGRFDKPALQRGFQVYKEVCSGCHAVEYLSFRALQDIGLSEDDVAVIAAEYEIEDGPNEDGEMFTRPGRAADEIPLPFPNDQAARAANNGALPPNLSLITKARKGGPDYLYALLTGYEEEPPEGVELGEGMSYNRYFAGGQIAMPQPMFGDDVEYIDGTEATTEQMAEDVTQFLMWAAEPKLEDSKRIGIKAILFLVALTAFFYASKHKIWAKLD
jgi:ubiquinol-cytochrome c reductase cytochrome c1 subunit